MNFELKNLPVRSQKPRNNGITMVMDKGLSLQEAHNFVEVNHNHVDLVKMGFGTSYLIPNLKEKIKVYNDAGMITYFGGTLFEAFVIRNQFEDFRKVLDQFKITHAEVSDGSIHLKHEKKCEYISILSKQVTVLSEVGSKDSEVIIAPYKWIELMQAELSAGSWKIIAEAREGGNVGVFRGSGEVRTDLVDEILTSVSIDDIIWEAPNKHQQVWFIKNFGSNVNLGNISVQEALPLETLRLGLRGDTFHQFL
jgi:phosphosulfolactate synthase